jgi:hypothetical protein
VDHFSQSLTHQNTSAWSSQSVRPKAWASNTSHLCLPPDTHCRARYSCHISLKTIQLTSSFKINLHFKFFWQYWDLNLGPHTCHANALQLEPYPSTKFNLIFFFFFAVLGFEFRAYTLIHSTSPFFVIGISQIGSHKLFAWAGLKPWSSWSLPPE